MKKVISLFICCTAIISLTGCRERYYTEEWRITNQELFEKCYRKYMNYAIEVVDSFFLPYQHTITLSEKDYLTKTSFMQYYKLQCVFEDGNVLDLIYRNQGFGHGTFLSRLTTNIPYPKDVVNINTDYFEMLHKIHEFSIFNLPGNQYTFLYLMYQELSLDDGGFHGREYYHDDVGYEMYFAPNDDSPSGRVLKCTFEGVLSDKNVWVDD